MRSIYKRVIIRIQIAVPFCRSDLVYDMQQFLEGSRTLLPYSCYQVLEYHHNLMFRDYACLWGGCISVFPFSYYNNFSVGSGSFLLLLRPSISFAYTDTTAQPDQHRGH